MSFINLPSVRGADEPVSGSSLGRILRRAWAVFEDSDDGHVKLKKPDDTVVDLEASGGSGLSVIGPYTVNFDDDGVLDATFKICDLAAGTIVVKTWAFMTTPWTTDPADGSIIFTIGLGGSDWASGDWWDVFRYDATWFLQNEFSAVETRLFDGGNANDARQVAGIVHDAGALNAYIQPSGGVLASGSAEVYALILAPRP